MKKKRTIWDIEKDLNLCAIIIKQIMSICKISLKAIENLKKEIKQKVL